MCAWMCINMQDLGGLEACSPRNFGFSEIASEAVFGQKQAVVATWLAEYCIKFLAVHICQVTMNFQGRKYYGWQNIG